MDKNCVPSLFALLYYRLPFQQYFQKKSHYVCPLIKLKLLDFPEAIGFRL